MTAIADAPPAGIADAPPAGIADAVSAGVADAPEARVAGAAPVGSGEAGAARLHRRRRWAVLLLLGVAALFVADVVVGTVVHDQRQRHLAGAMATPTTKVEIGDAVAVIQAPRIGLNVVVVEGAAAAQLRSGPGRVRGTTSPGAAGNVVILGHRRRYGGPLGDVGTLVEGDAISMKTRTGLVRTYKVSKVTTVATDSRRPFDRPDTDRLTLLTATSSLSGDRLVMVTATPDSPLPPGSSGVNVGRQPAEPAADALDERPATGLGVVILLLVLAALAVAVAMAFGELGRRYRRGTAVLVIAPSLGLLVVLAVYFLDTVVAAGI